MLQERIDGLKLSKQARGPVSDLVRALNAAASRVDIEREAAMQIEVIAGLEKTRAVRAGDAEALYMVFDDEVQERLTGIAGE